MAEPSPAPACTNTWCPASTSSRTPAGVNATRYSSSLTSLGTPTLTTASPSFPGERVRRSRHSRNQLPPPQRQPELDPVARAAEIAPGQLLDPADPVAQRVPVAVQPPRRPFPLAVLLDERFQRTHQLAAIRALAGLDRTQDRVAEQPQRLVVLQRQQELEGAEVAVRADAHRRRPRGTIPAGIA